MDWQHNAVINPIALSGILGLLSAIGLNILGLVADCSCDMILDCLQKGVPLHDCYQNAEDIQ